MIAANDNGLRFLSVCSGIEAASVAFGPLGWQAVAFSEIEKFPSAVLAHHYPDVPNLGDFTKIDTTKLGRVDILCGGTPCQSFSVAGLRKGLNDARGNLTLSFVELAHELAVGNGLRNVIWENVVGVLSDKTGAFGCFLAGLVGADSPIDPPRRGKWGGAGMVSGPKGTAAWRVLDGQYFGIPQRRRRVIVVADFGNGADPAAVLFEQDGVRRYSPPSREAGKDVAGTISARTKGGGGLGTDFDLDGGLIEAKAWAIQERAVSLNLEAGPQGKGYQPEVAYTLEARNKVQSVAFAPEIARCDATREGSSQDYETTTMVAVDVAPTVRAGGNQTGGDRPYGMDVDTRDSLAICVTGSVTHALTAEGHDASEDGSGRRAPIIAFDTTQITSKANRSSPKAGDPLNAQAHPPAIAVDTYNQTTGDTAHTVRAGAGAEGVPAAIVQSAVRRLTPMECERLQGFPDSYTAIPWRGKPADQCPDGPRYKALGNSWAVPKFHWLGKRLAALIAANYNYPVGSAIVTPINRKVSHA